MLYGSRCSVAEPAINAIVGRAQLFCHEPVFGNFTTAKVQQAADLFDAKTGKPVVIDWLNVRYDREIYCHASYYRQRVAHALRAEICDLENWAVLRPAHTFPLTIPLPLISEEYWEYVDVLESVVAFHRRHWGSRRDRPAYAIRPYRVVELGAGFGFWTLAAHAAWRQLLARRGVR